MKDKEKYGLLKIPAEIVIQQLRIELGILNSYIEELKHQLSESRKRASKELKPMRKEIKHLTLRLRELEKQNMILKSKK